MNKTKRTKAVIVAGALSLMLAAPVCTPVAGFVPGAPQITTKAEAASLNLSIREAKKRLRKELKKQGYTTNFRFDYFKTYNHTFIAFGIVDCTSGNCELVGYAEVNKHTGKVRFEMGCPDGSC